LAYFNSDAEAASGVGTGTIIAGPQIALTDVWLHDPAAAKLVLQMTKADSDDP
jgi:hypothetical protein